MKRIMIGRNNAEYSSSLRQITKGTGIRLGGSVFGRAVFFVNTLLLAKMLTTADLGLYFLSFGITFVATIFGLMGLRLGVVRFVSVYNGQSNSDAVLGTVLLSLALTLISSSLITLLLFAARDWISTSVFGEPHLADILGIFVFGIPIGAATAILLAATDGLKFMQYMVYVDEIIVLSLRLISIVVFVWLLKMGVKGAAISYLFSAIGGLLAAFIFCSRKMSFKVKGRRLEFRIRQLLRFSLPLIPASLLFTASKQLNILMLGWLDTANVVGIYSIAVRLINLPMIIIRSFQAIFNPLIAHLLSKRDYAQFSRLFHLVTRWAFTMSLPVFLSFILFPSFFMGLFSEEIAAGASTLSILSSAQILISLSAFAGSAIIMSGRTHLSLINNLSFVFLLVILNYILIPKYGILGGAAAYGVGAVLLAGLRFGGMFKTTKIHPLQFSLVKPAVASMLSLLPMCIYFGVNAKLSLSVMLSSVTASILIYMTMLVILRLDDDDTYILSVLKNKAFKAQPDV